MREAKASHMKATGSRSHLFVEGRHMYIKPVKLVRFLKNWVMAAG